MEVTSPQCAGLDVHQKTVVACCLTIDSMGEPEREIRTFSTMSAELLKLSEWLSNKGVTQVAMASTGEDWKPVYNLLEANFEVLVVNAEQIKNVPGRQTDVKDAEWIAQLLQHGLRRGSLIPPLPHRDFRDLTRSRTNERTRTSHSCDSLTNSALCGPTSNWLVWSAISMVLLLAGC